MKPTLWDNFSRSVFQRNGNDLEPVRWDSYYKQTRKFEDRRSRESSARWRGVERRNPFRCEICHQLFTGFREFAAHLPCRPNSHYELVESGVADRVVRVRRRAGTLTSDEVKSFRGIIVASLSEDAFRRVSPDLHLDYESYRADWMLCFLAVVRPQEKINPKVQSRLDWREAQRIEKEFFAGDASRRGQIVREIFDSGTSLEQIATRHAGRSKIVLSPRERDAFKQTADYKPARAAQALTEFEVKLDDGRTPADLYDKEPQVFYSWLAERRRAAGLNRKRT